MKIEAENLLLQCESEFKLPKNSFVFGNSAGYSFWYFIINGSEDPPVYFYIDYYSKTNNNYPIKIFDKLSDFYIFSIKSLTNN